MSTVTDLVITGLEIPDYALRGVTQTLDPLDGNLKRTVNGKLVDLSNPSFRKYRTRIVGKDQQFPDLSGIWPGAMIGITSIVSWGATGAAVGMTAMIRTFSVEHDEYGAVASWTLDAEEV